jgi:hypothetical protein
MHGTTVGAKKHRSVRFWKQSLYIACIVLMTHNIHRVKNVDLVNVKARGAHPTLQGLLKLSRHEPVTSQCTRNTTFRTVCDNSTAWKTTVLTTQLAQISRQIATVWRSNRSVSLKMQQSWIK